MMNQWISAYGSATATGLDPNRTVSKFYIKYDSTKKAWVGAIPHNIIIDAKTRKVLEAKVSFSQLPTMFAKYLP